MVSEFGKAQAQLVAGAKARKAAIKGVKKGTHFKVTTSIGSRVIREKGKGSELSAESGVWGETNDVVISQQPTTTPSTSQPTTPATPPKPPSKPQIKTSSLPTQMHAGQGEGFTTENVNQYGLGDVYKSSSRTLPYGVNEVRQSYKDNQPTPFGSVTYTTPTIYALNKKSGLVVGTRAFDPVINISSKKTNIQTTITNTASYPKAGLSKTTTTTIKTRATDSDRYIPSGLSPKAQQRSEKLGAEIEYIQDYEQKRARPEKEHKSYIKGLGHESINFFKDLNPKTAVEQGYIIGSKFRVGAKAYAAPESREFIKFRIREATKQTPKAVVQTFDVRQPSGLINVATTAAFVTMAGRAKAKSRGLKTGEKPLKTEYQTNIKETIVGGSKTSRVLMTESKGTVDGYQFTSINKKVGGRTSSIGKYRGLDIYSTTEKGLTSFKIKKGGKLLSEGSTPAEKPPALEPLKKTTKRTEHLEVIDEGTNPSSHLQTINQKDTVGYSDTRVKSKGKLGTLREVTTQEAKINIDTTLKSKTSAYPKIRTIEQYKVSPDKTIIDLSKAKISYLSGEIKSVGGKVEIYTPKFVYEKVKPKVDVKKRVFNKDGFTDIKTAESRWMTQATKKQTISGFQTYRVRTYKGRRYRPTWGKKAQTLTILEEKPIIKQRTKIPIEEAKIKDQKLMFQPIESKTLGVATSLLKAKPKLAFKSVLDTKPIFKEISVGDSVNSGVETKNKLSIYTPVASKTDYSIKSDQSFKLYQVSTYKTLLSTKNPFDPATTDFNQETPPPRPNIRIPPPTGLILFPPFGGGGFGEGSNIKLFRKGKQKRRYTPSLTSSLLNIRGKGSKAGTKSGLGIRPIIDDNKGRYF